METDDRKLNEALRRWEDVQCSPNFEADVWRRIRTAPQVGPVRRFLEEHFAGAVSAGALAGALAGLAISLAILPVSRPATEVQAFNFMGPTSLSGGYVQLAEED